MDALAAIVGSSPALEKARETLKKVATTDATVLLLGESGTGKELFAHALHPIKGFTSSPGKNAMLDTGSSSAVR